mmetsp:Transcript_19652/g.30792  ORF Transcript_19652/g.30792 Transcript_19652/m.30792 type:complete len:97 (-) Transcript_19652:38-328(-)
MGLQTNIVPDSSTRNSQMMARIRQNMNTMECVNEASAPSRKNEGPSTGHKSVQSSLGLHITSCHHSSHLVTEVSNPDYLSPYLVLHKPQPPWQLLH